MKLKQLQNLFHAIVNENSIVQHLVQIKNGIITQVNVNVKNIMSAKKIIVAILACIYENNKHLKSIADTSVTELDEIIFFIENVST